METPTADINVEILKSESPQVSHNEFIVKETHIATPQVPHNEPITVNDPLLSDFGKTYGKPPNGPFKYTQKGNLNSLQWPYFSKTLDSGKTIIEYDRAAPSTRVQLIPCIIASKPAFAHLYIGAKTGIVSQIVVIHENDERILVEFPASSLIW